MLPVRQRHRLPTLGSTQPHRKLVKHYHEPGDLHELTFSCYRRLPLLTNDSWRQQLARCIDTAGQQTGIGLPAFVFMPEHVHLLVVPSSAEPRIGRYLAWMKQPFSTWLKKLLLDSKSPLVDRLTVRERPGKTYFRFWQEGPGYGRNLTNPASIEAANDYIHQNPVLEVGAVGAQGWCHWLRQCTFLGASPLAIQRAAARARLEA